jgi:alpha-ribazole phosphatase
VGVTPDAHVILLRHGTADGGGRCYGQRLDPPLTPGGLRQAHAAAGRIGAVDHLVTSPALRARTTTAAFTADATVDGRWAERDFGDWEGRPWDRLWPTVPDEVRTDPVAYAAFTPPGGEPADAVRARVVAAVAALPATGTTLVVTHAGPIRLALADTLGIPVAATFAIAVAPGRALLLARIGDHWMLERTGW